MMPLRVRTLLGVSACLGFTLLTLSDTPAAQKPAPVPDHAFDNLRFQAIGPAVAGGRIGDVAVFESNPSIIYVGAATANLWRTVNNGVTWEVLLDRQPDAGSIGDVAISPDDLDVIWVGTGREQ